MENKNEAMRTYIEEDLKSFPEIMPGTLNHRMDPSLESCDEEAHTMVLRFPFADWERNGIGTLHGGIMFSSMDLSMSMLLRYFAQSAIPPTISLTVNFLRPVSMKEGYFLVSCRQTSLGKRNGTVYAEVLIPSSGKIAATGIGTFAIVRAE